VIWRLRLLLEGKGRRVLMVIAGLAVVLAAAGGIAFALTRGDDGDKGSEEAATQTQPRRVTFYLRALAPETSVSGCTMRIRYMWKPHFQAIRYLGETAVIQVNGPGITGSYRKPLSRQGLTLETSPVSLAGGYTIWSAHVASIGGDAPGNNTTIQAAPPRGLDC
jgi:hypothetical protein